MSINPLTLSLGIPIAARAIQQGMDWAEQSFQSFLSVDNGINQTLDLPVDDPQVSWASAATKLEKLASKLRQWLLGNGINQPFRIAIVDQPQGSPRIDVEGPQRQQILQLIATHPEATEELRQFVSAESGFLSNSPFPTSAIITDDSNQLIA